MSFNYQVRLRQWLGARGHSEQGQLGHLCGYWSDCRGRERLGSLSPEMFERLMPKPRSLVLEGGGREEGLSASIP